MRTTMIPMHEVAVKDQYDGERENMLSTTRYSENKFN